LLEKGEDIVKAAGRGFMRTVPNPADVWDIVTADPLSMAAPPVALGAAMGRGAVDEASASSQAQFEQAFASPTLAGKVGRGALGVASAIPFVGPSGVRIAENLIGGVIKNDAPRAYEGVGEAVGTALGGALGKGLGRV
jgi:hypothetical protein